MVSNLFSKAFALPKKESESKIRNNNVICEAGIYKSGWGQSTIFRLAIVSDLCYKGIWHITVSTHYT